MSAEYDNYLREHQSNVLKAFHWIQNNIPQVLDNLDLDTKIEYWSELDIEHDDSKWDDEEYYAYDNYFYGDKSSKVVKEFNYAWLRHIHNNPHHWQHWVLLEDEGKQKALEIPDRYIVEMICDWLSFSIKSGNMREIFDWYDDHKDKMILHPNTRKKVNRILNAIDKKLKENEEFQNEEEDGDVEHSGIKGQKWGVRHGPPYPLDPEVNLDVRLNAKHDGSKWEPVNTRKEKETIRSFNEDEHPVEKLADLKRLDEGADTFSTRYNINHPEGGTNKLGRSFNCPNCASAFEMTRRGYDVAARPAVNGSNVGDIAKNFKGGKLDLVTKDLEVDDSYLTRENLRNNPDSFWGHRGMVYEKVEKHVTDSLLSQGNGARGIMVTGWVRGLSGNSDNFGTRTAGFHAFNYEVKDGKVIYYDGQSRRRSNLMGNTNTDWIWGSDYRDIYAMRTDNLEPSEEICKAVYSNRKKGE